MDAAELCVLLTPREPGGHEVALLGWLADAVRSGLRPAIVAPTPALAQACRARGLAAFLRPLAGGLQAGGSGDDAPASRLALLRTLRAWPADQPLLLAPGVLHADAWLLAAALAWQRQVWVYVPMAYTAAHMGYRAGPLRDWLLAPWLRRVQGWITLDAQQALWLTGHWRVPAPVHRLPNLARLNGPAPCPPAAVAGGPLRLALVGRFDLHQKGLDWLIGTLQPATAPAALGPGRCFWRFQGSGPGEPALRRLAQLLGPQQAVVCGHAPLDDALAASDVLVLASRFEGLPLVALEATERGWPVVATRQSGLCQLLPARALYDFGDAQGLARAVDHLRRPAARAQAVALAQRRLAARRRREPYTAALHSLVQALRSAAPAGRPCQ